MAFLTITSPSRTISPVRLVTVTRTITFDSVLFTISTFVMVGIRVTVMVGLLPLVSVALHALYMSFSLYCIVTFTSPVLSVGMVMFASPSLFNGISTRPCIGLFSESYIVTVPFVTASPVMLVIRTFTVVLPILVSSTVTCPRVGIVSTSMFISYSSGSPSGSEVFLARLER